MKVALVIVAFCIVACFGETKTSANRERRQTQELSLSLINPQKCATRPKQFQYRDKNYFLSSENVNWLNGRRLCREYCMDVVSIETQEKNDLILRFIETNKVKYVWTSGHLCDYKECENRPDLEPKNVNGWFWTSSGQRINRTDQIPTGWGYNPWSRGGRKNAPQPDNFTYDIDKTTESCLAVLNNLYNDGIGWHDIACHKEKPVICEDNDELLNYVAATNPDIRL